MSGRGQGGPASRGRGGYVFRGGRGGKDGGRSGQTSYQRQGNKGSGRGNNGNFIRKGGPSKEKLSENEALETKLGFSIYKEGEPRLGWLMNISTTAVEDSETGISMSAINCYFMCQDGSTFKAQQRFAPYFYLATKERMEMEVESYLRRRYEGQIADVVKVEKEDLDLKNHLSGLRRPFLKLTFHNVQDLMEVKKDIQPIIEKNKAKLQASEAYETLQQAAAGAGNGTTRLADFMEHILEMREYDVPYHVRFAIDKDVRCGQWYTVIADEGQVRLERRADLVQRAEPRICAFDIETTKLPLKFPDSSYDAVMMISYMIDGQGYLVINRETVGSDIQDLEYTPKPEFDGPFKVINQPDERALLRYWFDHMRTVQPGIYVTYNGDFFDWPFIEARALVHGMIMYDEIGFRCDMKQMECRSKFALHLDAYAWVKRDSYLPQGSQGLKAVTKAKLGYDPLEVNPEDMVRFAMEDPQTMASYSVSDAVATYYLYTTYVHPFIFSLATVIPMSPDEVLRKGSGTLCEMLLMVEAFRGNIVCPNKHTSEKERFYKGYLLDSETYIGGHVECLESGVFRSDLPTRFRLVPAAYQGLIDNLDRDLKFAIEEEGGMKMENILDYEDIKQEIQGQLESLRDVPNREERPVIYHLDVAAMYPNIILTNRLQPPSIVTEDVCAGCDFNRPDKTCLRQMEWTWRGEHFMASRSEYYQVKNQIESEQFPPAYEGGPPRYFKDLDQEMQALKLKARLKGYTQKVYKKVLDKPVVEHRTASVCMRENPFYVDTVRSFRDRRYEYKALNKVWKSKLSAARAKGNPIEIQEAQDMCVVYDSLQLAHKCILNSFYGYVMRKGARWYSMEMAGVVTYTGAKIIQNARVLVEQIGKPLELDTDGIWCALPASFPENFAFQTSNPKKKFTISYPCVMLNVDVFINNTNPQYQTLKDSIRKTYTTSSECSIAFEVDGPYKAMILPASKEEGVLIKKRYAVFNDDGTLAELKGFEVKRRGELKLIKVFQSEVFENFLAGDSLEECYQAVAACANRWLDMLDNRGADLTDEELLEYISEQTTMSKSLADYGEQKSCATTTAKRLADFLGVEMVKDKGLLCRYIVARSPEGAPVSERAIPVAIFETEPDVMRAYLRRWCKEGGDTSIRTIVDWEYYKMRLGGSIQKIITIPAAMQKVANPVPRVAHPEWLYKKLRDKNDKYQQRSLKDMFSKAPLPPEKRLSLPGTQGRPARVAPPEPSVLEEIAEEGLVEDLEDGLEKGPVVGLGGDLEDFGAPPASKKAKVATVRRKSRGLGDEGAGDVNEDRAERDGGAEAGPSRGREKAGEAPPRERSPTPDRKGDYAAWLEHKKRKWKSARAGKKKRRLEEERGAERAAREAGRGERVAPPQGKKKQATGLGAFVRPSNDVTRLTWQILQIAPGRHPGEFTAWIVAGDKMLSVPLTIPRRFYLNKRTPVDGADAVGTRVSRTLPHARPSYNLLQIEVPEDYFHVSARTLATHLSDPDVEGVYETRLPLALNAVLQLGCVATVEQHARGKRLTDGFVMEDLRPKSATEAVYLDPKKTTLSYVYLYHSQADNRGLLCLHFPLTGKGLVVVVNPFANREVSATSMRRHFDEAYRDILEDQGEQGVAPELAFKVEYARTLTDAGRVLQSALLDYRDQHRGPMVAVVESPELTSLMTHVQALSKLPRVSLPSNAADSQYQALGWQPAAARLAAMRTAAAEPWLKARVDMARYVHVPLGNIDTDWILFSMDAFFARALREHDMLLWTSDNGLPDLGGVTEDEEASFADEVQQPELRFPGAYRSITIEITIQHLAVSALIRSGIINEMEGGSLLGFDLLHPDVPDMPMGARTSYDDSAIAGAAFKVLKQVVQRWLSDALKHENLYADAMLENLYRWLCSPQSTLHDPALHRLLHKVMHKLFALLIADMRKLGAQIVFADFSRVIIATGKYTLAAAQGYCDYLLAALKKRDLFEFLGLNPTRYWYSLLFMDKYNHGGLAVTSLNQGGDVSRSSQFRVEEGFEDGVGEGLGAGQEKPEILMDWNIAEFLPEKLRDYFYYHVSEFIYRPWKHAQEADRERTRLRTEATNPTPSVSVLAAADSAEEENAYVRQQVSSYFTDKLLRIVRDIQRHVASKSSVEEDEDDVAAATRKFPELAGSHLELGSPALEFVKTICAVMLLDRAAEQNVMLMRKNLLRLVHVREFSEAAVFRDPCLSFTLPNVICAYCNDCRDLDLCRDPLLLRREWRCAVPLCAHPYDREWVENELLQIVRQRSRLYQLQDLKCRKCRQVKSAHLAEQCRCAGSFICSESPSAFRQRMRVFHNIAKYHGFELLQECVDWLLEMPPKS